MQRQMKAVLIDRYGPPSSMRMARVPVEDPKQHEVRVKLHAVSLNASDCEFLTGSPLYIRMWGLFKPKYKILGSDIAGVVDALGDKVSGLKIGSRVCGDILGIFGGLAEYVCVPENTLNLIPENLSFQEASSLPQAAVVALQGLQKTNALAKDKHILINGAGGGAGSFAIQWAKMYGCEVTGVDIGFKFESMRNNGADHLIDYTQVDFTKEDTRYDAILDFVSTRSIFSYSKVLKPGGTYVIVGGGLKRILQTITLGSILSVMGSKKYQLLAAKPNKDLPYILELVSKGSLVPKIEKTFSLEDTPKAMSHICQGKAQGKIIITI